MGQPSAPLQRERLLQTLRTCVDELFSTMVTSFEAATVKTVEAALPREQRAIRFQDGPGQQSVAVHKQVVIDFDGDAKGQVVLRCSLETADSLTRGLLMMDESEELELSAIDDALNECANMLAGSLKTKALDPVGEFTLGLPNASPPEPQGDFEGALVYRVADGVMSVEVWLS